MKKEREKKIKRISFARKGDEQKERKKDGRRRTRAHHLSEPLSLAPAHGYSQLSLKRSHLQPNLNASSVRFLHARGKKEKEKEHEDGREKGKGWGKEKPSAKQAHKH